jgi:hypothetical protein
MRSFILCLALLTLASCGNSGSGSGSKDPNHAQTINGYMDLSNGLVGSSDLLTVTMDVPVTISADKIVFSANRSATDTGNVISCSMNFSMGEAYSYSVNSQNLVIRSSNGTTYTMTRSGNNGTDIIGTWTWSGTENGIAIHRRFSIPNSGRMIVNQDCES